MSIPSPRVISLTTGTIIRTVLVLLSLGLLWLIRDIVLYVFSALLLAGVMYPFVRWATSHKIPRGLAVLAFYLVMFGVIGLALSQLVPVLLDEAHQLTTTYGNSFGWIKEGVNGLKGFSDQLGFSRSFSPGVVDLQAQVQSVTIGLFGTLSDLFGGIVGFVVVLVLAYYLIAEEETMRGWFRNLIPDEYLKFSSQLVWQVVDKLGGWLRGQLVLGLIIGVLYLIGFTIVGVPYPLLLALLGGLLEFIPYMGPLLAAIPALFLAFSVSPTRAVVALVLIILIQQLENNLIVPKVMQRAVGLSPLISIVAFMIGARLFGTVGAIFAIPVATAVSVGLVELAKFRHAQAD